MSAERKQSDFLVNTDSKYKLVIAAAWRALELSGGAPRLVEADPKSKPAVVALQEFSEGKVSYRVKAKTKAKEKE